MARGHEVRIAGDTRDFERSVKDGVVDPLEDAQKAFDKLGDASEDAGREASRSLDRFEDDLKDAQQQTEKLSRAQKDVGDVGDRSFRKVGNVGGEVSSELRQNLGETFSSFRGDLEDLPQIAQDTLGGLAGSGALGGIAGLAATAAGAAGLGLITAAIQEQTEKAEALKERLSEAYSTAAEEGRNYLDVAQVLADAQDLMFNTERADEYKQLQEDAKLLGLDLYDVIAANAGETGKQREIQEQINALVDEYLSDQSEIDDYEHATDVALLAERWGEVIEKTEEEKKKAEEYSDVVATAEAEQRDQIRRTADTAEKRHNALAEKYGTPIVQTVKYEVDDSALVHYTPPEKRGIVTYTAGTNSITWE